MRPRKTYTGKRATARILKWLREYFGTDLNPRDPETGELLKKEFAEIREYDGGGQTWERDRPTDDEGFIHLYTSNSRTYWGKPLVGGIENGSQKRA